MGICDDWTQADVSSGSTSNKGQARTNNPSTAPMSGGTGTLNQSAPQTPNATPSMPMISQPTRLGLSAVDLKCPLCPVSCASESELYLHLAREHFSSMLLEAGFPLEGAAIFKCPMCQHCSETYSGLLKHYFVYHRQLEVLKYRCLGIKSEDVPEPKPYLTTDLNGGQEGVASGGPGNLCRMCDNVRFIPGPNGDFHKHLVETHFRSAH